MADYRRASNNIYTVLAFIAFLALLVGVGYVLMRHFAVFQGSPFDTAPTPQAAVAGADALALV